MLLDSSVLGNLSLKIFKNLFQILTLGEVAVQMWTVGRVVQRGSCVIDKTETNCVIHCARIHVGHLKKNFSSHSVTQTAAIKKLSWTKSAVIDVSGAGTSTAAEPWGV